MNPALMQLACLLGYNCVAFKVLNYFLTDVIVIDDYISYTIVQYDMNIEM